MPSILGTAKEISFAIRLEKMASGTVTDRPRERMFYTGMATLSAAVIFAGFFPHLLPEGAVRESPAHSARPSARHCIHVLACTVHCSNHSRCREANRLASPPRRLRCSPRRGDDRCGSYDG